MAIQLKKLKNQVLVITGASSGIGLTTALAAAKEGAKVVLAARNQEALAKIEQQIKDAGGEATHVVADVAKREDLQKVADTAISQYGGFDTWVNNAGVSIYGKLSQVSDEDSRRLFETNYWGVVYGSLIAAEHLRSKGGAIINLGSELSDLAIPLQGMYSASKHAVKGFTDALRVELKEDGAPVSVTLVKPAGINTPYPQHARNYTDHELTLPPPVYAPEEVAHAILHAAAHPERDIFVGGASKFFSSSNKYMPGVVDWINSKFMTKQQVREQRPAQHKEGALHQHAEDGHKYGNYDGHMVKTSYYTRASINPIVTGTVIAAATATAIALMGRKNGKSKQLKKMIKR